MYECPLNARLETGVGLSFLISFLHLSGHGWRMIRRYEASLDLTLAAIGLRLGRHLLCSASNLGGISNRVEPRYLGPWSDETTPA